MLSADPRSSKGTEGFKTALFRFFLGFYVRGYADMASTVVTATADGAADGNHSQCGKSYAIGAETNHFYDISTALHAAINPNLYIVSQTAMYKMTVCQPNADLCR